ncbi:unnamed protein product [Mytilus coruscus]|uniref:Uncharacterized protein n=1 Tax=Mytilus coruscus TaxID=42192 RepID=A0A6J8EI39_MYTCO|nr:unnamed protein product [Mytilus coruscus]
MNLQGTRTFYMPYLALYIRFVFLVLIGCFVLTDCNEDKQYATSEVQINTTSSISDFSKHVVDIIEGIDLSNDSSLQDGSQFSNGSTITDTVMRSTIVTPGSSQTERNSFVSTSFQSELKLISTEKPSMKTATIDQTSGTFVARIPFFLLSGDKTDDTTPNMSELDSTQLIQSTSKPKTKADLVILDSCSQYGTCEHISKYSFQFCQMR